LDWLPSDSEISLEEERGADDEEESSEIVDVKEVYLEYKERMEYFHRFPELNQYFYPECKENEDPAIMDEVGLFHIGFYSSDSEFRNLTKSTLSKILKNFVDYSNLPNILFILGNVRFLTVLFDINDAREQIRAYLTSPYVHKSEGFVLALEYILKYPRVTEKEKRMISELLGFLQE